MAVCIYRRIEDIERRGREMNHLIALEGANEIAINIILASSPPY